MKTTIIYGLCDPKHLRFILYVGKGRLPDPAQNHWKIFLRSGVTENNGLKKWFKKLKVKGIEPRWRLLETVSISKWEEAECKWIKHWRKKNPDLFNVSAGGNDWPFLASAKWYSNHPKALKARNKAIAAWYKRCPKKAAAKMRKIALWFQQHPKAIIARARGASVAKKKWHQENRKRSHEILAKARSILPKWLRHKRLHVDQNKKVKSCRFCKK